MELALTGQCRREVYKNRYRIEGKLGWGHFSTVWLATDWECDPPSYVAIKFQKAARHYYEAAHDEIELLQTARLAESEDDNNGVVKLLDSFIHSGPHGKHVSMVFEVMGPNLLSLIKHFGFQGVPLSIVRKIARNVLVGLDHLHRKCSIIHTDLKPENVLVARKYIPQLGQCKSDSLRDARGSSAFDQPAADELFSDMPLFMRLAPSGSEPPTLRYGHQPRLSLDGDKWRKGLTHLRLYKLAHPELYSVNNELIPNVAFKKQWRDSPPVPKGLTIPARDPKTISSDPKQWSIIPTVEGTLDLKSAGAELFNDPEAEYKIVDLGNGCWTYKHFSSDIQTRQYRSPEVLLGVDYDTSADIWSFACLIFELVTVSTSSHGQF